MAARSDGSTPTNARFAPVSRGRSAIACGLLPNGTGSCVTGAIARSVMTETSAGARSVALPCLENAGEEVFQPGEKASSRPRKKRKTHGEPVRECPGTPSESAMREWLMEAADRDPGFRDRLLFSAKDSAGSDVSSLEAVVRRATTMSGFVDGRGAGDDANRLGDLVRILDERIGDGNPKWVELIAAMPQIARNNLSTDRR